MSEKNTKMKGSVAQYLADHPRLLGFLFVLLLVLNQGLTSVDGCPGTGTAP